MKKYFSLFIVIASVICSASTCAKVNTPEAKPVVPTPEPDPTPQPEETFKYKTFAVAANSMVYYGGFVKGTGIVSHDQGMFCKLMKAGGHDVNVYNCTQGGHYLRDFLADGCKLTEKACHGQDHMAGVPFDKVDCIIISEAGTNTTDFMESVRGIAKRVSDKNPDVKKVYINHVYSVYKKHNRILDNLKTLHDQDGFTIINCGQLAYDIYTGAVKVPGGSLSYKDRYTFCNHTSSDTYHPNPLMGYIMTQMLYCALTGENADYEDYANLIKGCYFAAGSVSYSSYYNKYYTTAATPTFMDVIDNPAEMKGIQQLIPQYINKY